MFINFNEEFIAAPDERYKIEFKVYNPNDNFSVKLTENIMTNPGDTVTIPASENIQNISITRTAVYEGSLILEWYNNSDGSVIYIDSIYLKKILD